MSKELPYFKFYPGLWITGDITMLEEADQGVFINVCAFYWMKQCSISLANAKTRFKGCLNSFENLLKHEILKVDDNENLIIEFLDEQFKEFSEINRKRSESGRLGYEAKAKQKPSKCQANANIEEKIREEKIREENNKREKITNPTIEEIKKYFYENGFSEQAAIKFFNYYGCANWCDSKGKKVKSWKQKAQAVWFTDQNRNTINHSIQSIPR